MKMIRDFAEEIREELNDAEHYAMQAERYKDKDQAVSSLYSDLSLGKSKQPGQNPGTTITPGNSE